MTEFDFDKFLQDETRQERDRQMMAEIRQFVDEQLREANFYRVYDGDPEINQQLGEEYATNQANWYFTHPEEAFAEINQEMPEDIEEREGRLIKLAIYDAQIRNLEERQIISRTTLLLSMQRAGIEEDRITKAKKEFLADLIVEGWKLEDDMVQFFIRMTPGESLDVNSEEDRMYFVESFAQTAEVSSKGDYLFQTTQTIAGIISINSGKEMTDAHAVATTLATIGYTTQLVAEHGASLEATAQRENSVMEVCRRYGLTIDLEDPDNIAKAILEILEARYPLTGENT